MNVQREQNNSAEMKGKKKKLVL